MDYLEENNRLRKQLTSENERAYGDVVVYLRLSHAEERQTEELLLEIIDHLLEIQKKGGSYLDLFGSNSERFCDELLANLPGENKSALFKFGLVLVSVSVVVCMSLFLSDFHWWSILIRISYLLVVVMLTFKVLKKLLFLPKMKSLIYSWLFFTVVIVCLVGIEFFIATV
ncbi:hypothetical protein ACWOFR_12770 [Carnobacterium gallinarum]|uniref:hypothetical protein n=1 Tax=Carnobacterium gallinarum TaxID=2749 RepID=UPI00068F007F|nr:hypothetical protein [Carnobacterium gallinarum]